MAASILKSTTVTPAAAANGKNAALSDLYTNKYDFSTTRYPLTGLGGDDAPHYVTFNINLPSNSEYVQGGNTVPNVQSASQNNFDMQNSIGAYSQVSSGSIKLASEGAVAQSLTQGFSGKSIIGATGGTALVQAAATTIELKPKLKRIKKTIAIYMPDTVVTQVDHSWDTTSLTDALGAGGQAAAIGAGINNIVAKSGQAAWNDVKSVFTGGAYKNPIAYNNAQGAETIGTAAKALGAGEGFQALALRGVNAAINPQVEMIFKGTGNRGYIFEFDFQPRSAQEGVAIQDIIKTFKMYAAAEITKNNGRYFIPPGQFDIKFFFKNVENLNIARISTCVLKSIYVNYAGSSQFATFADGQPVHIHMQLIFTEADIITRNLIDDGGF